MDLRRLCQPTHMIPSTFFILNKSWIDVKIELLILLVSYLTPVTVGNTTLQLDLDTGSADL